MCCATCLSVCFYLDNLDKVQFVNGRPDTVISIVLCFYKVKTDHQSGTYNNRSDWNCYIMAKNITFVTHNNRYDVTKNILYHSAQG